LPLDTGHLRAVRRHRDPLRPDRRGGVRPDGAAVADPVGRGRGGLVRRRLGMSLGALLLALPVLGWAVPDTVRIPKARPHPPGTAPAAPPPTVFAPEVHQLLVTSCKTCHVAGGPAGNSRLLLTGKVRPDFDSVRPFADPRRPRESLLVTKAAGQMHGGGPIAPAGSKVQRRLLAWITSGALFEVPAPGASPAPLPAPLRAARPRASGKPMAA